jgi:cytochrome c peroxidase
VRHLHSAPATSVVLGASELTAGIPGKGPLKVSDIKAFLAKPENHATLQVELPDNLRAGAAALYIPEDNPMTRAKIELGRQLYFDTRLSVDGTISCAPAAIILPQAMAPILSLVLVFVIKQVTETRRFPSIAF